MSNNISLSFFSDKIQFVNGEVVSEEGGFYLEKTNTANRLCYRKQNLVVAVDLVHKSFGKLKGLTNGIVIEYCSPEKKDIVVYDDIIDYDDDTYYKARNYQSMTKKEPALLTVEIFHPE